MDVTTVEESHGPDGFSRAWCQASDMICVRLFWDARRDHTPPLSSPEFEHVNELDVCDRSVLHILCGELENDASADLDRSVLPAVLRCLQAGVLVNAQDKLGLTALHLLAQNNSGSDITDADLRGAIFALVDAGADLELRDALGMTPLMRAALIGSHMAVSHLVAAGANANATFGGRGPFAKSALVFHLHEGLAYEDIYLTNNWESYHKIVGAEEQLMDFEGWSPLRFAVLGNDPEVVRTLERPPIATRNSSRIAIKRAKRLTGPL